MTSIPQRAHSVTGTLKIPALDVASFLVVSTVRGPNAFNDTELGLYSSQTRLKE